MTSEPNTTPLLNVWFLTSNIQATKKVEFLNYVLYGKGIQCHSNHSPQLFELKQKNKSRFFKFFLWDILSNCCNAQYFHITEHTYARLTFVVSLVDNEFSSKYWLHRAHNYDKTYHHH